MGGEHSLESAYPRVVYWIDDKEANNQKIIEKLQAMRITVHKFCTTDLFIRHYREHLVKDSHFSTLRIITDMNRIEDGKEKKTAGFSVVKKLRKHKYRSPILIYQGKKSVQRTREMITDYNNSRVDIKDKLGCVFVESDKKKAFLYASFSTDYPEMNENLGQDPLPQAVSIGPEQFNLYKDKFHRDVIDSHVLMLKDNSLQAWKQIQPDFDLSNDMWEDIRNRLPDKVKDKEWHCLLIRELRLHHFRDDDYDRIYFKYMEELMNNEVINEKFPQLPLYCAIAVRLYTGTKLYHHFRDDLKAGNFKNWTLFTAAIESALYYLPNFSGIVWRGTNSLDALPFHHDMMKDCDFAYVMIGVTSTTQDENVAIENFLNERSENPTIYELYIKKGSDISYLSAKPEEKEVLLPIFSFWRVIETEMDYNFRHKLVRRVKVKQIEECDLESEVKVKQTAECDLEREVKKERRRRKSERKSGGRKSGRKVERKSGRKVERKNCFDK